MNGSNTNDKLFLLSYKEVTNSSFWFLNDNKNDSSRIKTFTDYAKAQGACSSGGSWWLRSPRCNIEEYAREVDKNGKVEDFETVDGYIGLDSVDITWNGIAPACYLSFK